LIILIKSMMIESERISGDKVRMTMEKGLAGLEAIFRPRSVAVIGASDNPGKLGFHVMKSLTQGRYPGKIFPVNPGKGEILGIKVFQSLSHIPEEVDLSIIVLPAEQIPKTIKECESRGVHAIILITAGFKEIEDKRGEEMQREITDLANQSGIKVIGPNTFGVINLHLPLNASFTPEFSWAEKGRVSLVSQSGGMSHLMAFLSMKCGLGLSKVIGLGNRCNVDFADMVDYLMEDPETDVIALYIEGIDHPRRLMDAANRGSGKKPVLVYKVGRSRTSDRASQFHTGSLAGKHEIYKGAFRQARILMVESSEEFLDSSKALALCPLPQGRRVAILSGQAGPGMAASDVCEEGGLLLSPFSAETRKRIEELLPPLAIRTNPVDMGPAWYDSEAIKGIVQSVLDDRNIDAILLFIMFASANRASVGILSHLLFERRRDKPIFSCFSAPDGIWEEEIKCLERSGIPNYPTPERAARSLVNLVKFKKLKEKGNTREDP
jgi:acyl-CoA synthetase (NDP forming)